MGLVPPLNLAKDPTLEEFARQANELAELPPDTLRKDKDVRKDAADKAAQILARMADFMTPREQAA